MENNPIYQRWHSTKASEVPLIDLKILVALFMADAEINLGTTADSRTLERCIWHAGHQYGHLPICYIASGYARGSLGDFGAGRLVPNTIKKWMDQITEDFLRAEAKHKIEETYKNPGTLVNLKTYPVGQALMKKIDWLTSRGITSEEWDRISLKKLAADLQAGHQYESDYYLNF